MLKNKGFIILLGVLLLLNVSFVLGATGAISSAFEILKNDFNIPQLYDKYPEVIESLIYMTLFIALGMKAGEVGGTDSWNKTRAGKTVFVVVGIMLGISTMLGFRRWGITLETIGVYGGLLLMLGLIWGVWKLFNLVAGKDVEGHPVPASKRAFFSSFGILLGYYIANTITGGELANFLGNPNNPFIASIFKLALVGLFITMFISLIMMLFSAVGKSGPDPGAGGEKKGFLKGLADGIRGISDGGRDVISAVKGTFVKDIPPDLQKALNTVFARIEGFSSSVNDALIHQPISEGSYNGLHKQADSVNNALIELFELHGKHLQRAQTTPHPNDNIGRFHAGMLVKHLELLADAHRKMTQIKVQ